METFPLAYADEHEIFSPVQYVKIVPVQAWGNNFNFSVWYVELRGIVDLAMVKAAHRIYQERQRQAAWKLCLRFLKSEPAMAALLPAIEAESGFFTEAPLTQALYQLAVEQGDFAGTEALLKGQAHEELFAEYVREHIPYESLWERLDSGLADGPLPAPSKRGGHQMCWDPVTRRILLFGGWDGNQDLAEFWMYDVATAAWTCISHDTRLENGPSPRSCHKICIHAGRRLLYVLGRFVEQDSRTGSAPASPLNEFHQYDLEAHVWSVISPDVQQAGGPPLLYDHQMVVDEARSLIYSFGGRVITTGSAEAAEPQYAGLYVYSIEQDTWRCLRPDDQQPERSPALRSRIGHSMILDPERNLLYIFAGQRNKDYLADYLVYDLDTDTVVEYEKDTSRAGGPDAGFTQRSTIDLAAGEIYLLSGLMREKPPTSGSGNASAGAASGANDGSSMGRNTFWVHSLASRSWTKLEEPDAQADAPAGTWPCPRFAHQLAYDEQGKCHYLFGGNPGDPGAPKRRLNDFWRLRLHRAVTTEDVLRKACFLVRRQQYYELCLGAGPQAQLDALKFLQTQVSAVVRHTDAAESEQFRSLSSWLFQPARSLSATPLLSPASKSPLLGLGSYLAEPEDQVALSRRQLFDDLAKLLPRALSPPTRSLLDLVHQ